MAKMETPPGVTAGRGSELCSHNNNSTAEHSSAEAADNQFRPRVISHRKVRDSAPELPHIAEPAAALAWMNARYALAWAITPQRERLVVLHDLDVPAPHVSVMHVTA